MGNTTNKVAIFILKYITDRDDEITNLKLQKLVYYCQAWFLAIYKKALFQEDFEAWVHGPVLPDLYQKYRDFKWQPILISRSIKYPEFTVAQQKLIENVIGVYGNLEPWQLEGLVHSEDPWRLARKGIPDTEPSKRIITKESMQIYYEKLLKA